MINLAICFFIAALASFLGSLQPGPVNLQVIRIAHLRGTREGIIVAIGGSIPELIYVAAAFFLTIIWIDSEIWKSYSHLVLMIFLLGVSIYLFFKQELNSTTEAKVSTTNLFFSGFLLALLNPQLLPFWIFTISYIRTLHFIEISTTAQQLVFAFGSAFGAFLILAIFSRITAIYRKILTKIPIGINKIISLLFASLALLELFKFLYS